MDLDPETRAALDFYQGVAIDFRWLEAAVYPDTCREPYMAVALQCLENGTKKISDMATDVDGSLTPRSGTIDDAFFHILNRRKQEYLDLLESGFRPTLPSFLIDQYVSDPGLPKWYPDMAESALNHYLSA